MIALIDGDILIYVIGFASNDAESYHAESRLLRSFNTILDATQCSSYRLFVSDSSGNFRNQLFPAYKANRVQPKPVHYKHLSNFLLDKLKAEVTWGEEADDALGIESTKNKDSIIVSIDKDLLQIPGTHYNWRTNGFKIISPEEGRHRFWKQVLTGDATDNITPRVGLSCPGVGEKKAERYLEGCTADEEYYKEVLNVYTKYLPDYDENETKARLITTAQLVKIRTTPNEIWTPPV